MSCDIVRLFGHDDTRKFCFNYFRTLKRTEYEIFQLDEVQVFQNLTHPFSSTYGHDFLFTRTS